MSALPQSSRAAVLVDYNQPLQIRELALPPLEPGAILVKVEAATVCGSDVHASHGRLRQITQLPLVPGHEIVGRIVQLGEGREKDAADQPLRIGDRIVWAYAWCGRCYYCAIARQPTLCPNAKWSKPQKSLMPGSFLLPRVRCVLSCKASSGSVGYESRRVC